MRRRPLGGCERGVRARCGAGSWLKDVPPEDGTPGASTAAAQMLGNALRGSQGSPLQYGPQTPPQSGWDMREEVRAENAARAAAGAPLATDVAAASDRGTAEGRGPAAWREDVRYEPDTPYTARTSMGHLDPMDGDDEGEGSPDTADAVRALAQGLGVGAADDADEFPWLQGSENLGRESEMGAGPEQVEPGVWDMGGGAGGASASDFDDVPGWKFDGFEGMGTEEVPQAAAGGRGDVDRPDAPQQLNEDEIDEQVWPCWLLLSRVLSCVAPDIACGSVVVPSRALCLPACLPADPRVRMSQPHCLPPPTPTVQAVILV